MAVTRRQNGIFENASLNRARGSDRMTATELEAAQRVLNGNALRATLLETTRCALKGASVAAAMAAVVAVLEYGLLYQRGEITEGEMYRAIVKSVVTAGISGAAVSGLLAAMAIAFPPLIPVVAFLCVPTIVIGFAVLGSRLAVLGKGLAPGLSERTAAQTPGTSVLAGGTGDGDRELCWQARETQSGLTRRRDVEGGRPATLKRPSERTILHSQRQKDRGNGYRTISLKNLKLSCSKCV